MKLFLKCLIYIKKEIKSDNSLLKNTKSKGAKSILRAFFYKKIEFENKKEFELLSEKNNQLNVIISQFSILYFYFLHNHFLFYGFFDKTIIVSILFVAFNFIINKTMFDITIKYENLYGLIFKTKE